jgi:hypothetical protein
MKILKVHKEDTFNVVNLLNFVAALLHFDVAVSGSWQSRKIENKNKATDVFIRMSCNFQNRIYLDPRVYTKKNTKRAY